jgi:hypothetical protein
VGERRRDGFGERPWSSLFDPAANVRALGEIQRRGLQAAGELVDRLVGDADGHAAATSADDSETGAPDRDHGDGHGPNRAHGAHAGHGGSPAAAHLFEVWVDLLQRGFQAVTGATVTAAAPTSSNGHRGATLDLGAGVTTGTVRIDAAGGGGGDRDGNAQDGRSSNGRAEAAVWLHNGTAEPRADVSLHCGDLRAHDGSLLPASAVRFDPDRVDELPARSSRGVVVSAVLHADQPAGIYRGVILAAGVPDVWLPLEVVVDGTER